MFLAFEPKHVHSALKGLMGLKKPREIEVAVLIKRERYFYFSCHVFQGEALVMSSKGRTHGLCSPLDLV